MTKYHGPDLCHCLAARRNARYLTRLYDRYLSAANISISQFSILAMVSEHPGISVAELADRMVMERTTLVRALKPLQLEGFISTEAQGPRSAIRLSLTVKGRAKVDETEPYWLAAQKEREEQIGADAAEAIRDALLNSGVGH